MDTPEYYRECPIEQHHVLCAVNQNTKAYQDYLINAYKRAGSYGLKGIFRDSHFNMAADTLNYRHIPYDQQTVTGATIDQIDIIKKSTAVETDMVESMHEAEAHIQHRFQNELNMLYYVESPGMMGTPMVGTRYDDVCGYEFLFQDIDTGMNPERITAAGDDIDMAYFKGLSVRMIYQPAIEVNDFPEPKCFSSWWNEKTMAPMNNGFETVENYMDILEVLDSGAGVRWKSASAEAVLMSHWAKPWP